MHIFLLYFSGGDVGKKGDEVMREDMEKNRPVLRSTDKDGNIHQHKMERQNRKHAALGSRPTPILRKLAKEMMKSRKKVCPNMMCECKSI